MVNKEEVMLWDKDSKVVKNKEEGMPWHNKKGWWIIKRRG